MDGNDCKNISLCIALTKEQSQNIRTLSVLQSNYRLNVTLISFILGQVSIKSIYKSKILNSKLKQIYHLFH